MPLPENSDTDDLAAIAAGWQGRALKAEAKLDKPLRETILAVLTTMPSDIQPEHLAAMIESQVKAWQAL